MKTSLVLLALALVPTLTFADSFNCDSSPTEHLHVRIQDNVDAADGTRTAAVLIVTDVTATFGNRTRVASKKLLQDGAFWTAETNYAPGVDGEKVGNFDRSELSQVQLYIPTFDFNVPNKDGQEYKGHLFLFESQNTETFSQDIELSCVYNTKK